MAIKRRKNQPLADSYPSSEKANQARPVRPDSELNPELAGTLSQEDDDGYVNEGAIAYALSAETIQFRSDPELRKRRGEIKKRMIVKPEAVAWALTEMKDQLMLWEKYFRTVKTTKDKRCYELYLHKLEYTGRKIQESYEGRNTLRTAPESAAAALLQL